MGMIEARTSTGNADGHVCPFLEWEKFASSAFRFVEMVLIALVLNPSVQVSTTEPGPIRF